MSLEIVLVPLAIAAVSAVKAARAEKTRNQLASAATQVQVSTRMRDIRLLGLALGDTGAGVSQHGEELLVGWTHHSCTFRRNLEGIWSAHFADDINVDQASALIRAVDTAYGRRVQQALLQRLRERAPQAGMEIESETIEEDATVTMVLNINRTHA